MFYIQAIKGPEVVTLIVEKTQVQSLAAGVEQFLNELAERQPDLEKASGAYQESEMKLEKPVDPAFRVGQLGLGYDEEADLMVLVARELQPQGVDEGEAGVARFWCSRTQMLKLSQWGQELADRGRPICGNCGQPIDPEGHFCPKRNGHKS